MQQNVYYNPQDELDEELNIDLKKIWMILWSRKEIIIKIFCCVLTFFILLTFIMPKKYKVEADLYIHKSNNTNLVDVNPYAIEELGAGGGMAALMAGGSGTLANELEIMQSPLIIDKVIRENDLKIKKIFGFIPNKKEGEYISTKSFLKKNISIENKKGTNVVTIEYTAKKPELAYNIVTSIIKNSMEVRAQLQSEKAKNDTKILEEEYNKLKAELNSKVAGSSGMPQTALTGTGNIAAISAFSKSAQQALAGMQGQYKQSAKSQIDIEEGAAKLTQVATKLQWAKMVQDMSDSSKILVLKEPQLLRDFEYSSPKLMINIILGILFGVIAALFSIIIIEVRDKKLSYSKLGDNIIYNNSDELLDIQQLLLTNKDKQLSCIFFENPSEEISKLFTGFKNLNLVKADISEELIDSINKSEGIVLLAKIGATNAKLYSKIKTIVTDKNKKITKEVLL